MGKNRRTNTTQSSAQPSKELVGKMRDWQESPVYSPSEFLTEEEINWVKEHMENSKNNEDIPTGHLYRMERGYHFEDLYFDDEINEGSILKDSSIFRSFSREPDSTGNYLINHNGGGSIVIYRTNGDVPHYNITKHTNEFIAEKESWVEPNKLKIDKIQYFTGLDNDMKKVFIKELELNNYPDVIERYDNIHQSWFPDELWLVDVSSVK